MLKDTGERVIPECMKPMNGLLLEHLARYSFSTPYVSGRTLDIACGVGYGTQMLAKACKKQTKDMVGADIDPATIDYAKKHYAHTSISYITGDVLDPELYEKIGTFDTIVSFETIEHVQDDALFMTNIYKLLNPGGMLILSTPFGQGKGKPCGNPFHFHQFTREEFMNLFHAFDQVDLFYQRGVAIERGVLKEEQDVIPPRENVHYPLGIAVCKK